MRSLLKRMEQIVMAMNVADVTGRASSPQKLAPFCNVPQTQRRVQGIGIAVVVRDRESLRAHAAVHIENGAKSFNAWPPR